MTPIRLNARPAYEAALKAAQASELAFQKLAQGNNISCNYRSNCAIAVSLTPEQREYFDNEPSGYVAVSSIIARGEITSDDTKALAALQREHDDTFNNLYLHITEGPADIEDKRKAATEQFIKYCTDWLAAHPAPDATPVQEA